MKGDPAEIRVFLKYYLLFFIATGNLKEEQINVKVGSTLRQLLQDICVKYGDEFSGRLWDQEGELFKTAWILLNGNRVNSKQLDIILEDKDKLIITTPMLVGG